MASQKHKFTARLVTTPCDRHKGEGYNTLFNTVKLQHSALSGALWLGCSLTPLRRSCYCCFRVHCFCDFSLHVTPVSHILFVTPAQPKGLMYSVPSLPSSALVYNKYVLLFGTSSPPQKNFSIAFPILYFMCEILHTRFLDRHNISQFCATRYMSLTWAIRAMFILLLEVKTFSIAQSKAGGQTVARCI